jgi:hypothetical protein
MPATFWAVLGYFILFSSTKAEGAVRTLGRILAVWSFVIAGFIVLAGAYATLSGWCSMDGLCSMSGMCSANSGTQ